MTKFLKMVPLPSWWLKFELKDLSISELFEDLLSWNLESKLITPKNITNLNIISKVAPFSNILSCWADHYGSMDTWNIKISSLVIILWQNILGQQHIAMNSLLTTLPIVIFIVRTTAALYYTAVEIKKNAWNTQTDREQRIQSQTPLLSPWIVGVSGPISPKAIIYVTKFYCDGHNRVYV